MADAKATWSIELEDKTSNAALSAAGALQKLQSSIDADTRALSQMQKAMRNLQQGNSVNIEQYRALKKGIDEKKESIAKAQQSFLALGGSFEKAKPTGLTAKLEELRKTTQGMPGPLDGILAKLTGLGSMLGKGLIVVGLLAIAAAMAAVTAAAIAGTAALLQYGIAAANARRAEALRLEGLTKQRNWWGIAAGNSKEMQQQLDRVSASSALGRDKLAAMQAEMYRSGLRGKNLGLALEAVSTASMVVGEEGAARIKRWAVGIGLAGGSVQKLADDVKARFGKTAAAMLLDLNVQTAKLKENFDALFTGLEIEGLLSAVASITALFSQSTASGRALKTLLNTLLQPLIATIEWATPYVRRFFQGAVLSALYFASWVLRVRNYLREAFDTKSWSGLISIESAAYAGVVAFGLLAAAVAICAVGFGVLLVGALILAAPLIWSMVVALGAMAWSAIVAAAPFLLIALAIGVVIAYLYQLYRFWSEVFSLPWEAIGSAMVRGIVNGVKGAWKWLTDTMSELGDAALGAFKQALHIASPSRAFAELGKQIPAGVAQGVNEGRGAAESAAESMVDAAAAAPAAGSRSVVINVGGVNISAAAGADARTIAGDIEAALVGVFERLTLQLGVSPA